MKSAVYNALLCFIFIVSGHIQEVEANLMNPCDDIFGMEGQCGGPKTCEKLYSKGMDKRPPRCECTNSGKNTYSCVCKLC
uniref:S locus protein 11 n=2 Tax=Brassica campestris TaxID=3711 RepID=Q1ET34_BRACM|nr:S locus protein 11 [Brassica rapa]